jgi:hypothetical protein
VAETGFSTRIENVNAFPLSAETGAYSTSEDTSIPRVLFGRFMLPDMSEHPCQVGEINADGVKLLSSTPVETGTTIIAYLDDIGRVDGEIAGLLGDGFYLDFKLSDPRRERMQKRIDWLLNSNPEQRRHDRFAPKKAASHINLSDGREYACEVIDISVSGAAIKCHVLPSIGTYVNLGKMRGRVVRYTSDGFAIEFLRKMDPSKLELHATL